MIAALGQKLQSAVGRRVGHSRWAWVNGTLSVGLHLRQRQQDLAWGSVSSEAPAAVAAAAAAVAGAVDEQLAFVPSENSVVTARASS